MTKLVDILSLVGFILIPLILWAGVVHQAHVYTFMLVCFIGLSLYLPSKWFAGFGLYIALWWSLIIYLVWTGRVVPQMIGVSVDAILFLVFGMIAFLAIFNGKVKTDTWFNVICISALIQAVIGFLQYYGVNLVAVVFSYFVNISAELPTRTPVGTLGNNNFLAAFLAVSLPFFFRRVWLWVLPFVLFSLFLCKTSTAGIAVIVGTVYYIGGWKLAVASIGLVSAYFYFFDFAHIFQGDRWDFWKDALVKLSGSWKTLVYGFGPGITWQIGNELHNEYVMAVWNYGLVGLTFLLGYIVTVYREHKILFTSFLILCIDAVGNHVLHTVPTAVLAIVIIALIERERLEDKADGI